MLSKWHSAGIKPAVDYFRYAVHFSSALRTLNRNFIDIRTMQFYLFCLWITVSLRQLLTAADALLMSAFTLPYI